MTQVLETITRRRGPGAGAGLAVVSHGEVLIDVSAGESSPGIAWTSDSLAVTWSAVKPVVAATLMLLASEGAIDLDAPISAVWPEFAAKGKHAVTLRHALTHTAGLPFWPRYQELCVFGGDADWAESEAVEEAIADAPLQWTPGRAVGYHAFTVGWIAEGVCRRATGESVKVHLSRLVSEPLGLRLALGAPTGWRADVAAMRTPVTDGDTSGLEQLWDPDTMAGAAVLSAHPRSWESISEIANGERFAEGGAAAAAGFTTARALAGFWDATWNSPTLEPVRMESARMPIEGEDLVLRSHTRRLGANMLATPDQPWAPFPRAWGHSGLGGQMGFGDPVSGIGVAFISNTPAYWEGSDADLAKIVEALAGFFRPPGRGTDPKSTAA
ncbi:MAG: serine hydrolase domain-containing protein [Protaetiibacter sp.]